ncbi:nucleolar protein 10, putative [Plasmodium chabaudi chabaudi]|uniref:Nucleolar protein 10, putative n=1 Tax=Plasmodium chabaudi chabaudi TaxID=31271 RepID=A0A1C6YP40_PLACU|nr:nucleolar protein 10, putative [Plasmodium chabaudi chabaudi]
MIKSFINNGIKIYSLTSGKLAPDSYGNSNTNFDAKKKKKNSINNNDDNSVEVLHDLEFSQKSDDIKISDDGRYLCVSGMYPPQVGLYDTSELSIKHRRHFDEEVLSFVFLTSNYEKLAFLCKNRYLEFHNAAGKYYKMRIPKEGRSLMYNKESTNLYITASYEDIYILNLQKGCYESSIKTKNEHNNFICKNMQLPIFCTGGSDGYLEIWDEREKKSLNFLNVNEYEELTSSCFSDNGLKLAVGTSKGIVKLFDIRHSKPLLIKDHCNDIPIKKIEFLNVDSSKSSYMGTNEWYRNTYDNYNNSGMYNSSTNLSCNELVASCDENCIKIYSEAQKNILSLQVINFDDGKKRNNKKIKLLNNECVNINSFTFYKNSGLCFIPCDNKKVFIYFIPYIGIAPKWCNFLDNITEELEEKEKYKKDDAYDINNNNNTNDGFDDYVFLTNQQIEQLNIAHMKGTKNLIPYLHGYYIPSNIYVDIKSVMQENDLESYKNNLIQKKLQQKQQMRISDKSNILVNKNYVDNLLNKVQKRIDKKQKAMVNAQELLQDDRFNKLFYDPEYMVETVDLDK